jgi:titin
MKTRFINYTLKNLLPATIFWAIATSKGLSAVYTVNSLGDAGTGAGTSGDLRYCINQANAAAGPHTIEFTGLSGTINLTATLPVFTRQITVAGNTGAGYALNAPVIQINAANAGWGFLFNNTGAANSVIRGLVINRAQFTNIEINGVNSITIQDCFIGTNLAGTASAGANPNFGIQIVNSSNNNLINNVVSGHATHGILINVNSTNNILRGNRVGTNNLGTAAIANVVHGIEINNTSTGNIIGGAAAADRNIISGNGQIGLSIVASANPQIINNYIGVNAAGTGAIANGVHGIFINNSASSTITDNVVSGNAIFGMLIINSDNHIVRGNKVGTNAAGTAAIGNGNAGISFVSANFVTVGGTAAGQGNLLSGNGDVGLRLESSSNATIQGNLIGTNAAGTGAIGNNSSGIFAISGCNNNLIGGTTTSARNVISCNRIHGIQYMVSCNDLQIKANYIGTDINGGGAATTFGNGEIGVIINDNCLRPIIGGTTAAERNVISGNGRLWVSGVNNGTGIQMIAGVTNAVIRGNYVGLAADGTTAMGNRENGIVILGGCDNALLYGNVVSSNGYQGVVVNGAHNIDVFANYCGTDVTGTLARGNGQSGVILIFSNNGEIGRAVSGEGNILSNNGEHGLHLVGGNGTIVYNNKIGVAANGTTAMGNRNGGVYIQGVGGGTNGSNNVIGGTGSLQANIIAYSTGTGSNPGLGNGFGVGVAHNEQGIQNTIIGNKIFCNAGLGIDLNFSGLFGAPANGVGNGGKPAPAITAVSSTSTSGTGIAGETIHVYSNTTCTTCQGEIYLGSAVVNGAGSWTVTHVAVADPSKNSATATSVALGTSQFSCNFLVPVRFGTFEVQKQGNSVVLSWTTLEEKNNDKFIIERSLDGENFVAIGEVQGAGNSSKFISYSYTDAGLNSGQYYYRIRQVDLDHSSQYSPIRSVSFESAGFSIYPNPVSEGQTIYISSPNGVEFRAAVLDELGKIFIPSELYMSEAEISLEYFAAGVYLLELIDDNGRQVKKILKK